MKVHTGSASSVKGPWKGANQGATTCTHLEQILSLLFLLRLVLGLREGPAKGCHKAHNHTGYLHIKHPLPGS